MADLIGDLEAIQRGEPPLRARKRYDPNILQGLAESGETVQMESPVAEEIPAAPVSSLVWMLVLGGLLGISVIVNIVLLATR